MKQSKKLLSIFLAMLMLIGTVSVVGNAAVAREDVHYDSMDNAALTPEQVANIILDLLDRDVMPGLGVIDLSILGELRLNSIDNALTDIYGLLNGRLPGLAGGDVATIAGQSGRLKYGDEVVQRKHGDLQVLYCLLDFLMNETTAGVLKKAPYGILEDGGINASDFINTILGWFNLDLSGINAILMNIDGLVAGLAYDMLLYGSYGHDLDAEELKAAGQSVPTPDATIATAITTLLTKPQKYTYNADGTKDWDMDSVILSETKLQGKNLSINDNSILDIVDQILQTAYEDFGTVALNHDVKKLFMEALGVDFVTLDEKKDAQEIADIKADADFINVVDGKPEDAGEVKNYFCNAQMWEVDGVWYFRDYVTRPVLDADGNIQYVTDENGNQVEKTALQHRYQRAEAYNANDLYEAVNWNYKLDSTTFNFDELVPQYKSIIGCLNHIIHVILETAINPGYLQRFGVNSIDDLWVDGDNTNFNENLMTTAKFLLKNFTFEFFGRNPLYVDLNTLKANADFIKKVDSFENNAAGREGLIAYMLLPFLGDALPQLVYDLDMFTPGVQIEQTAALLVREFLSDLTPQINYDDQIFVDASLASGRTFQTKSSAQWMELILNMGLDLAAVYLDNISSFNVDLNTLDQIKSFAVAAGDPAYMGVLEEIVDWAIDYISDGQDYSVILGLEPGNAEKGLNSVRCVTSYNDKNDTVTVANNYAGNAFDIVSTALNKLLPLGMLVGCSTDKYALDVQEVFKKLIDVIDDLDLEVLLGVFGRTGRSDSLLEADNIPVVILNLANRILSCLFGNTILVADPEADEPINNALTKDNLGITIYNLLTGLNARKEAIVRSALPLVALFISDFGGEQTFKAPGIDVDSVIANTGDYSFTVKNKSYGIWRGYMKDGARQQDYHYNLIVENVAAYNFDGSASSYVTISSAGTGTFGYGASTTVNYKVNSIPAEGAFVRFDVTYRMTGSDGNTPLTTESSTISKYMWLRPAGDDLGNDPDKTYSASASKWTIEVYGGTHVYDVSAYTEEQITAFINSCDGKVAYTVHRDSGGTTGTGGVDVSGAQEQNGWKLSQIYKEKTKSEVNVTATYNITNKDTFSNAVRNGGYFEWKYSAHCNKASSTEFDDEPAIWLFYNGADRDALRGLVEQEIDMKRVASDYNTSSQEWQAYVSAFQAAAKAAYQPINSSMVFNFKQLYEALDAAVENVEKAKVSSANDVTKYINALKNTVKTVNTDLGGASFRTYALYRWYDLNDLRNDAYNMINLYERAQATAPDTKFFPYSGISEYDLKKLVNVNGYDKTDDYILALLQDMSAEDAARAKEDYRNAKKDLANLQASEIADTNDLLGKSVSKLLPRSGGVVNTYLIKEINSAVAVIGRTNNAGYSERSWKAYDTALKRAEAVKDSPSQDTIFDAKYQLQVARNNLIPATQEADYEELLALIKQAETVMNNAGLYNNTDAEFGAVLAALGYELTDADGNTVQLFPGSAKTIENVSFDKHDQDEIDDVADDLKKALSKMVFKNTSYGGNTVENSNVPTGELDKDDNPITESVKTTVLSAEQILSTVKAQFAGTTAANGTVDDIRISLDDNYTLENGEEKFVGTGATITIYTTQAGVKVPLSTIKVVVKGDVTGDGVVDVLDCMIVELAATNYTEINGVYNLAGDLDGVAGIEIADLSAVANIANKR